MYSFFDYLPHAQYGMEQSYIPRMEDFPDYNSYRAAMDQYTAMNGYDNPESYDTSSQQVRWHPEWNTEEIIPQQAQMIAQAQNVQSQQPVAPVSGPIPTRPGYTGPSIVDYLGMNGKASDFSSRKVLAESLGIKNYKGTASQNTKLLKQLLDGPNVIDGYNFNVNSGNTGGGNNIITGGTGTNGGGNNVTGTNVSGANDIPVVPFPPIITDSILHADHKYSDTTNLAKLKTPKATDGTSGTTKMLALVAATVAAGGITAYEATKLNSLIKSGAFKNSAQFEEQLANAKFSLKNETMDNIVNSAKEFQTWWKGLPKKQKSILNNLDANEIAGYNSELKAGTSLKNLEAYNMVKEAEAEANILKDAKLAEGIGNEARTTGQILKEAYIAAKNTPWIMKTLNTAKKLRFEDGGSTLSGNAWYQDGGNYDTNTMNVSNAYGYEMGGYVPDYQMAYGGIHINPANEGKFTASAKRAGMGVQEFASHVLANREDYSSTQVKRANFAHNAAGWNKANGGMVGHEMEVTPQEAEMLRQQGYQFEIL